MALAAFALVLGLAACNGDEGDEEEAGGAAAPGPEAEPADDDVEAAFEIPAKIDADYVNRVLAELDRVQGDVFRRIVAHGAFAQADLIPLRAVFNDPELTAQAQGFASLVSDIDKAKNPPGDNRTTVVRLLTARPDCIYAETAVDVSATVLEPPPPRPSWVALRPSARGSDPQGINPTPFSIVAEHAREANPCG